jgi:hypothetical protein
MLKVEQNNISTSSSDSNSSGIPILKNSQCRQMWKTVEGELILTILLNQNIYQNIAIRTMLLG